MLREHYERLDTTCADNQCDDSWKERVEKEVEVTEYSEMPSLQEEKVIVHGKVVR